MNSRVEAFIEQARELSREDRIAALDALQVLVAPPDASWEAAWAEEAESRIAAYERGEIEAEDIDSVMERLRQEFLAR